MADGKGPTLSSKNPDVNNSSYQSWAASGEHGTPGSKNDVYTTPVDEDLLYANYKLYQNYPNPFNPDKTIKCRLNVSTFIHLNNYYILGREVATKVNQKQKPGNYEVVFSGEGLGSGIYLYQLKTGEYSKTNKMILMK